MDSYPCKLLRDSYEHTPINSMWSIVNIYSSNDHEEYWPMREQIVADYWFKGESGVKKRTIIIYDRGAVSKV